MPDEKNISSPGASLQDDQEEFKRACLQSLRNEEHEFDSANEFPSGWWIIPLMFVGIALWMAIIFWIVI